MGKLLQFENAVGNVSSIKKNQLTANSNRPFRLVRFTNKCYTPIRSLRNSKCAFEVHKAGLKLSGDFCENWNYISVLTKEVLSIELTRGRETIDTFYLSPLHILSKIGLSNAVARHFRFHPTEYKISQTTIKIIAKEQELELITSGYRFEKLLRAFKKMGYADRLKVERKPSVDLSDFKDYISNS